MPFNLISKFRFRSTSNCKIFTLVASYSSAECVPRYIIKFQFFNFPQVIYQVAVRVWKWISEVNWIIIMFKFIRESESMVTALIVSHMFTTIIILKVWYIITSTIPAFLVLIEGLLRHNHNFHTVIVKTFWFKEIKKIKFHFLVFPGISYSKVKPLSMPFRVDIILKYQVVF